jgi:hypothetical protein
MAASTFRRVPELQQVARRSSGRRHDRVARLRDVVQGRDQLALAHPLVGDGDERVGAGGGPPVLFLRHLALVVVARREPGGGRGPGQRFERTTRVGDDRQRALLASIAIGDVDRDEVHRRVLEDGL